MNIADTIVSWFFRNRWRGQTRIHRLLCGGRRIKVRSKYGIFWQLDPYEYVDSYVLRYGYYEQEVLDAALNRLLPHDVFWDIGSNLGLHALTVCRLRSDVVIFAFEPNPKMADLIEQASQMNRLKLMVLRVALDANSGQRDFFIHEGNSGRSGLYNWDSDPCLQCIRVNTETADRIIENKKALPPNVVKIDVEGNEPKVLIGMRKLLESTALHTVIFEDSPAEESEVKTMLRKHGFIISKLIRREPTQHNLENYVACKQPNQAPEPTSTAVMPDASASATLSAPGAHL